MTPAGDDQPVSVPDAQTQRDGSGEIGRAADVIRDVAVLGGFAVPLVLGASYLVVGLKLWSVHLPWPTLLASLPHGLVFARGLPAVVTGVVAGGALYVAFRTAGRTLPNGKCLIAVWLLASVVLAAAILVWFKVSSTPYVPGARRASGWIALVALVANLVSIGLAVAIARSQYIRASHMGFVRALRPAVMVLAVFPFCAFFWAAFAAPSVRLCGQAFVTQNVGRGYVDGNLLGTDGQWIYLGERASPTGDFLAVIPVKYVDAELFPQNVSCGLVQPLPQTGGGSGG